MIKYTAKINKRKLHPNFKNYLKIVQELKDKENGKQHKENIKE